MDTEPGDVRYGGVARSYTDVLAQSPAQAVAYADAIECLARGVECGQPVRRIGRRGAHRGNLQRYRNSCRFRRPRRLVAPQCGYGSTRRPDRLRTQNNRHTSTIAAAPASRLRLLALP